MSCSGGGVGAGVQRAAHHADSLSSRAVVLADVLDALVLRSRPTGHEAPLRWVSQERPGRCHTSRASSHWMMAFGPDPAIALRPQQQPFSEIEKSVSGFWALVPVCLRG